MGLFDNSQGGGMGYADVKNTRNFTNDDLYNMLKDIKVSFGTPEMGDIKGTPSVLYKSAADGYDVFVRVEKDKVIMGKLSSGDSTGLAAGLGFATGVLLGRKDANQSKADRAVDELLEVIKKLEAGESVTESASAAPLNTATGDAIEFFMKQKLLAIKPKFDIFDKNEAVVYHVEGDITRLNFSIQKAGSEVLKLKKKLVAIMPEYTILKNGSEIGKLKKKLKLTKPELTGTINGQELSIKGDLWGYDFDLVLGGKAIGHVDTAGIWTDCYRIAILDEELQDVVIALAIICDNVHDQENSN